MAWLLGAGTGTCSDEVVIVRDSMGVPHIYSDSATGIFYGVGYAAAEDRLFQIEMIRRLATGQMSEIFGPEYLEADKQARIDGYTEAELQ